MCEANRACPKHLKKLCRVHVWRLVRYHHTNLSRVTDVLVNRNLLCDEILSIITASFITRVKAEVVTPRLTQ